LRVYNKVQEGKPKDLESDLRTKKKCLGYQSTRAVLRKKARWSKVKLLGKTRQAPSFVREKTG